MSMSDGPQFSFVLNSNPKDPISVGVIPTRFKWKQMVLNSSNKRLMFTLNLSSKCSLFLLYYREQNHLHFLEYIQGFELQILFLTNSITRQYCINQITNKNDNKRKINLQHKIEI